jgi:purine-binding chemotaxis protein CheW
MSEPQDFSVSLDETREDLLREAERLRDESERGRTLEEESPPRSLLLFSLGREWYAVDLAYVRKILRAGAMARVPGASPEVLGLMNSHGEVLCVLDLRKILGAGKSPAGAEDGKGYVVVLHHGEKDAGILVDAVDDVWEIPGSLVLPPLESLEPSRAKLFEGTIVRNDRFVGLLCVSMCLNP